MATLGFHFFVLVLFGLLQAAPQAARAGFVQGSVIDAATGQPLKDATATLRFRGRRLERTMKTDEKGLFTFMDVEPGPYELKVEQPGYLSQKYGQVSYDIPLPPDLVVEAGGRYNVRSRWFAPRLSLAGYMTRIVSLWRRQKYGF